MNKYMMYCFISLFIAMASCKKSVGDSSGSGTGTTTVPAVYSQLYGGHPTPMNEYHYHIRTRRSN